ncbi:MAG: rod shape-determining protein RodA [Thermodesulfobacteriota bacterium]
MFDRRLIQHFDWWLLGLTLLLATVGLTILYSAVTAGASDVQRTLVAKQAISCCIGLGAMIMVFIFNYKELDRWGGVIYLAAVVLLIAVMLHGRNISGARRWLSIGPVMLQPSEPMKIAVIVILAKFYSKRANINGFTLRELILPMILVMFPFLLIVKQPDLGTGMLVLLIAASMTVYVKIERRSLICIIVSCLVMVPMLWSFFLKEYQQERIKTFLNPERDPLGSGYHIIQSKIAIGSGKLVGKGFLKGTQNALSFLPEHHTDFIISVLSEEWGFIGTGFVLVVFLLLIVWGLRIAYGCRDPFGTILSVGVTAMFFWQVFINVGMVMGLMPVVGVPLPLISYGGSSVVTSLIGIGLLMNVSMRRFIIE